MKEKKKVAILGVDVLNMATFLTPFQPLVQFATIIF
jgi:hypothetical protein